MHTSNPFFLRRWIFGLPAPFWLKNGRMIEEIVHKNQLKPVPAGSLPDVVGMMAETTETRAPLVVDKRPYPGGIRVAHLHFKGDIYLLEENLWREVSGKMVKEFQAKLSKVNTVNFEQAMELSETMESLG